MDNKHERTGGYKLPHYAINQKIPLQSLSIIAREIMSGEWGQGDARDKRLVEKGYNLDEVYAKIDQMFGTRALPFTNYDVIIIVPSLHVRQGPSFDHYVVTTLIEDRTHYTIIEEEIDSDSNVWGALRSGLGWINLEFAKRVEG